MRFTSGTKLSVAAAAIVASFAMGVPTASIAAPSALLKQPVLCFDIWFICSRTDLSNCEVITVEVPC